MYSCRFCGLITSHGIPIVEADLKKLRPNKDHR